MCVYLSVSPDLSVDQVLEYLCQLGQVDVYELSLLVQTEQGEEVTSLYFQQVIVSLWMCEGVGVGVRAWEITRCVMTTTTNLDDPSVVFLRLCVCMRARVCVCVCVCV